MDKTQLEDVARIYSRFTLCGCGTDGTPWGVVLKLLEIAEDPNRTFYEGIEGADNKWVQFGAHVLDHVDLLGHETGIDAAYLQEPDGVLFLAFLREYGVEDNTWPSEVFVIPED